MQLKKVLLTSAFYFILDNLELICFINENVLIRPFCYRSSLQVIGTVCIALANIVEQLVRVQEKRIAMKLQHRLHYSNAGYARKNVIILSPCMLFFVDWLSI